MNLLDRLLIAQTEIDTSYANEHQRTYSTPFESGYWFPEEASQFAAGSDFLFMAITLISAVFFVIIVGVMIYFAIKYRRRPGVGPQPSSSHNTQLEIIWSVIPSIILVWFFYEGAAGYFEMRVPTDDAEEIYVVASRWNWTFRYPNGDKSDQLHLVQDKPAKLIMQSEDVLHSLFVSAFRQKMDIVPGRYTYAFIIPTKQGKFRLSCTEYCGQGHSRMRTLCQVHPDEDSRRTSTEWIRADYTPWENGKRLFDMNCSGCHKMNGEPATGPALNLIWGEQERMITGDTVLVDEAYIKKSIEEPNADVVENYGPVSKMNSFAGKFKPEELMDLTAYIKYAKDPVKFGGDKTVGELELDQNNVGSTDEADKAPEAGGDTENSSDALNDIEGGDDESQKSSDLNSANQPVDNG